MKKNTERCYENEIINIKINDKKEDSSKKMNRNKILNKLHSIKDSISNKNNGKFVRRKNNFKKGRNDIKSQENSIIKTTKSKSKIYPKSNLKNTTKNKIICESKNIKKSNNNTVERKK